MCIRDRNICDLLISSYMIEPYGASLYHIPDKVVPDINMLGSIGNTDSQKDESHSAYHKG